MAIFEIEKKTTIKASPEVIRKNLLDFETYDKWSSFIQYIKITKEVESSVKPGIGSLLEVSIKAPSAKSNSIFKPIVLTNDASSFSWKGVLGFEFIFVGTHIFEFNKVSDTETEFIQREEFNGILAYLGNYLIGDTLDGFENYNKLIKQRSETL